MEFVRKEDSNAKDVSSIVVKYSIQIVSSLGFMVQLIFAVFTKNKQKNIESPHHIWMGPITNKNNVNTRTIFPAKSSSIRNDVSRQTCDLSHALTTTQSALIYRATYRIIQIE